MAALEIPAGAPSECVDQVVRSDTPRLMFGRSGSIYGSCARSDLPALFRAVVVFAGRAADGFEAFAAAGDAEPLGTGFADGMLDRLRTGALQDGPSGQVRLDICLPKACAMRDLAMALHLIWLLRVPQRPDAALELLGRRPPVYAEAALEFMNLGTLDHVEADREHFRSTGAASVVREVLALDRLHADLRAHRAAAARTAFAAPLVDQLLKEYGQMRGLKAVPLTPQSVNGLLIYAYQTQAHFSNSAMLFDTDGQGQKNEQREAMLDYAAEASQVLYQQLLRSAAELGVPAAVRQITASAFAFKWPLRRESSAERAFANAPGREVPVYRFREVCVRDMTRETDFLDYGGAVSAGRRLELITIGLPQDVLEELQGRPLLGRFAVTNLASTTELAARVDGHHVHALRGRSLLWYDGHKRSARCPDCANIEHALVDDLLLELAAWYADGGEAQQIVYNLLGSIGEISPKQWYWQLLKNAAGEVPLVEMHAGDVACFEQVILNLHPCPYKLQDEDLIWRPEGLHPGLRMEEVMTWVRQRLWASSEDQARQAGEPEVRRPFAVFARQSVSASSVKRRRWLGYEEVAQELGAEVIDFARLSFDEEVRMMRSADVFVTVPGAHHAAVIFMRPGAVWAELSCAEVSNAFYWYRGFRRLVAALGVRFAPIEAQGCPAVKQDASQQGWAPLLLHPISVFGQIQGHIMVASDRLLCSWRSAPGDESRGEAPLEAAEGRSGAMMRCNLWEDDCQSVRPAFSGAPDDASGTWELLRKPLGSWRKQACAERRGDDVMIVDRTRIVNHDLYDADLQAPQDVVRLIRCLHPEAAEDCGSSPPPGAAAAAAAAEAEGGGAEGPLSPALALQSAVECEEQLEPNVASVSGWFARLSAHATYEGDASDSCRKLLAPACPPPPSWLQRLCAWILTEAALSRLDGDSCDAVPSEHVDEGERWLRLAEETPGDARGPLEALGGGEQLQNAWQALDEGLEARARMYAKVTNTLLRKLWTMSTRDEADFATAVQSLAPLPDEPAVGVCVDGATISALESYCFLHFAWSHFVAVVGGLARAGLLGRRVRLVFSHPRFLCPRSQWLSYYGLLADELPTFDRSCAGTTVRIAALASPVYVHYEEPEVEAQVTESHWRAALADCRLRPLVQAPLLSRVRPLVGEGRAGGLVITWLRKGSVGVIPRTGEEKRDVRNDAEVRELFLAHARAHGGELIETTFDDLPWHRQVAAVAGSDVWMAIHGSGLPAHEPWMKPGSIAVEVSLNSSCFCAFAYCAHANRSRDFAWVLATTQGADCGFGEWAGRVADAAERGEEDVGPYEAPEIVWPSWKAFNLERARGGRDFDPRKLLQGLAAAERKEPPDASPAARFRAWAAASLPRGGRACGGLAVQVED